MSGSSGTSDVIVYSFQAKDGRPLLLLSVALSPSACPAAAAASASASLAGSRTVTAVRFLKSVPDLHSRLLCGCSTSTCKYAAPSVAATLFKAPYNTDVSPVKHIVRQGNTGHKSRAAATKFLNTAASIVSDT